MIWKRLFGKNNDTQVTTHKLPLASNCDFLNNLLQKHQSNLKNPSENIWSTDSNMGLKSHLSSLISNGILPTGNFLIVLNTFDPPNDVDKWTELLGKTLSKTLKEFLDGRKITCLIKPQVTVAIDGVDVPRQNLKQREFLTIFTPHRIKQEQSEPIASIYFTKDTKVQLLGLLMKGQKHLTIGNHWLDTYSIESLPTPVSYHLEIDGQLHHHHTPQLQSLKKVTPDGTNISFFDSQGLEQFTISIDKKVTKQVTPSSAEETTDKLFHVVMRGLLLQKIHFHKFIIGYHVYIERTGELTFYPSQPVAQFWISTQKIEFTTKRINFKVNGKSIEPNQTIELSGDYKITYHRLVFQFYDHRDKPIPNWPYVAEISYRGRRIPLRTETKHIIGREASATVNLPSSKKNDNIVWLPEFQKSASIPTKTGMVLKENFSSDTILVASKHCEINLENGKQTIQNISRNCFAFLYTQDRFIQMPPKSSSQNFGHHDRIYLGNHVFEFLISKPSVNKGQISPTDFVDNAGVFVEPINSPNRKKWPNNTDDAVTAYFEVNKGSVNPNAPTVIEED